MLLVVSMNKEKQVYLFYEILYDQNDYPFHARVKTNQKDIIASLLEDYEMPINSYEDGLIDCLVCLSFLVFTLINRAKSRGF